ncbi:MAG TPA: zinc-dependent metalloprotease family protein [Acidimicrobiales bacterium]|nr:zinc-dependent metalloprotease family protein [Acidimicrobiales bacterium]
MKRLFALFAALVAAATLLTGLVPTGRAVAGPISLIDQETDCLELVPESVGVAGTTDDGAKIVVSVLVYLDGSLKERDGYNVFAPANRAYKPLNIELKPTYRKHAFNGTDVSVIFDQLKDLVGGKRPKGFDIVVALTRKDIEAAGIGRGVAGIADCIGGIRFDDRSFAISEAQKGDIGGVILAHELGHILGAHHHYANCYEDGDTSDGIMVVTPVGPAPTGGQKSCTLMYPSAGPNKLLFGTLESLAVRGHASDFARP